jgi:hypothetical protein
MSNPTVGRRAAPEAAPAVPGPLSATTASLSRAAYAIPFASLIGVALLILIFVRLADLRLVVSGSAGFGR